MEHNAEVLNLYSAIKAIEKSSFDEEAIIIIIKELLEINSGYINEEYVTPSQNRKAGRDPDFIPEVVTNGYTLVLHTAELGKEKIVRFLVTRGADLSKTMITNGQEKTAFNLALENNYIDVAKILFVDTLIFHVYNQNLDFLKSTINQGINNDFNVNAQSLRYKHTVLSFASKKGYLDIVKSLLDYNVDILIEINTKKAWQIAAESNHWDIVRILFEAHFAKCLQHNGDVSIYLDEIMRLSDFLLESLDPSTKLQLSIIREIDYTARSSLGSSTASASTVSNEPEDRILLKILTSASSHFVFKLVCSKITKKWHISFSDITEKDLEVSNIYFRKIVEVVGIDEYKDYFKEIINVIIEQETIDVLPALFLGIKNIEHLQASSYKEESYLTLVRRDEYSFEEKLKILEHGEGKIICNFNKLKKFVEDNKKRVDTLSSGLDDVRTDVEELEAKVKELQIGLDYLRRIIGTEPSGYESDPYKHTLYLSLRWYLSSSYAAAFVASSPEGIVASSKVGTIGKVGSILEAVSPQVPFGGGIVVQFFAAILKSIDEKNEKNMIENYAKLAPGTMGMEALSHEIAVKIIDIIGTLDIERIESSTKSIAKKCIDMITEAVSWASNNEDQVKKELAEPVQAVGKSVIALTAIEVQDTIVEGFTQKVEELSNEEQRGQKHALVIATLLISKIYTLNIKEQNLIHNMEEIKKLIDVEIVSFYAVSSSASAAVAPAVQHSSQSKSSSCTSSKKKHKCVVSYLLEMPYDNEILNNPELVKVAYKIGGVGAVNKLIDLGQDKQLANAIVEATKYYKLEYLIRTILEDNKSIHPNEDFTFTSYTPESLITNNRENILQEIDPIIEQNFFFNNPRGIKFIQEVAGTFDSATLLKILELGKDFEIAEQVVTEAELQGIYRVVYTLMGKEMPEAGSINNLENIITVDELNELQLVPNGIFNSWSNKAYLRIVEYIDNLAKNLDSMLNVGKSGNQVAIIITLLEEWLNFAASGHRLVSMPYFYHRGDDDYPYGSGSGGENYYNLTETSKGSNELIGLPLLSYNETSYIPLDH